MLATFPALTVIDAHVGRFFVLSPARIACIAALCRATSARLTHLKLRWLSPLTDDIVAALVALRRSSVLRALEFDYVDQPFCARLATIVRALPGSIERLTLLSRSSGEGPGGSRDDERAAMQRVAALPQLTELALYVDFARCLLPELFTNASAGSCCASGTAAAGPGGGGGGSSGGMCNFPKLARLSLRARRGYEYGSDVVVSRVH